VHRRPPPAAPLFPYTTLFRSLRINEGLDSFHSVAFADSPFTGGSYYDYHLITPWLAADGALPPELAVLSLGEAAGTFGRLFAHRSEEHTSELQSRENLVCRLL